LKEENRDDLTMIEM